jgi:hypothetical protein
VSSGDFDVAFITPVLTYGARYQEEQTRRRERGSAGRMTPPEQPATRSLLDFGNWSEYLEDFPPVLLVRVTPKFVEGFWTTVARGAARSPVDVGSWRSGVGGRELRTVSWPFVPPDFRQLLTFDVSTFDY